MKKIIAWLLVLALTAAISIGATLAYLTDTDEDVNVMTLGKVKIDQLEYERIDDETQNEDAKVQEFHNDKPLYPAIIDKDAFDWETGESFVDWEQIGKDDYTTGIWNPNEINNELDKMVFVKNTGDYDAYVRSVFAFEVNGYTLEQFQELFHLNINETDWTWEWVKTPVVLADDNGDPANFILATATYNKVLKPGELTEISLSQIALDPSVDNADILGFGDIYQINVNSQAIQADGFGTPAEALNEGFGVISETNYPFETYEPLEGIDLRSALRFYQGDASKPIHTKITNVVFGLKRNYPDVVKNYEGNLVTEEQDVNVYTYYVPNGANYDVYFLANGPIYSPKNSGELFYGMSAMQKLDTTNLDTSRTESMYRMLRECTSLKTVDVSGWDTGNVVNMQDLFRGCSALTSLDASNWDVSKVTNMYCTFFKCTALTDLNVSTWDTGNVTDMAFMFRECTALTSLDVSNWDVSKVEALRYMFFRCYALADLDVSRWNTDSVTKVDWMFGSCPMLTEMDLSNWDVSNVVAMNNMFYGSTGLKILDVSTWDVSKVTNFEGMFASLNQNAGDMQLHTLDLSNWNPASATTLGSMFYGCGALTKLDLSDWNMPNLTTVSHMFADCHNLEVIDVSGWQVPAITCLDAMFNHCKSLKSIDLSSFDTSNVREFSQLFEHCYSLETIKGLEKLNTQNGHDFSEMFSNCYALKELDLSAFVTTQADPKYLNQGRYENLVFLRFMDSCTGLEKVTFGPNFSFDGKGDCPNGYKFQMPSATNVEGWDGKWYTADGTGYLPSEIPEMTAATYYAVKPVTP